MKKQSYIIHEDRMEKIAYVEQVERKGMLNRHRRETNLGHFYRYRGRLGDPCIYCNRPSTDWDHTTPLVELEIMVELGIKFPKPICVRSCQECNDKLGSFPEPNISERIKYLKEKYMDVLEEYSRVVHFMTRLNDWMK